MSRGVVGIDPRLRARRIAVRRAEGRRRLRTVLFALGLVATLASAWGISRSALLDLDRVRVDGVSGAAATRVLAEVPAANGTPLLDLDLGAIEAEVTSLPWIESAEASRQWPGTLNLKVVERTPVAALPSGSGAYVLIDAEGVALAERSTDQVAHLPLIALPAEGSLGSIQSRSLAAIDTAEQLPSDLRPWVEAITLDTTTGEPILGLDLVGSGRADLGDGGHIADKLESLRAVLAGADLRCVDVVDVSVADLPTITRDPGCEAALAQLSGTVAVESG